MSFSFDPAAATALPAAPRGPHPFTLLWWIWVRPRMALTAVRDGRRWLLLIPLLVILSLLALRVVVEAPYVTELRRQASIEQMRQTLSPQEFENLPPEALQGPAAQPISLGLLAALGPLLLVWVVRAGILHLLGLAFGGQNTYGSLFSTAAWASLPLALRTLLQIIFIAGTRSPVVGSGLAGLMTPAEQIISGPAGFAAGLLSTVDLFSLWYVILLGMAMWVSGRLSRNKVLIIMSIYVVLSLLLGAAPSLLMGALSRGF